VATAHARFPVEVDPTLAAFWAVEAPSGAGYFGWDVAGAGDVNGDGYDDLVVGANLYDDGSTDEGGAFVYLGGASGPASTPDWQAESEQASADFGIAVAGVGDVDGDGYDDIAVGATLYDNGEATEGLAQV
jgi:hypothetical protein